MRTAIVGGGAAGFFLAISLKERCPEMDVTIFERGQHVLRKVRVSGGGRCNCTNTFELVNDLSSIYPRGHRLLKRLFRGFDHRDAIDWFERHGVALTVQDDHCVFPASQDAQTIVDCFLHEAHRHHITIHTSAGITSPNELDDYDFVAITTGGIRTADMLAAWIPREMVVAPCPSLFSFAIPDTSLHSLMGTVVENATVFLPGTKFRASGALLITHWGMSGPAILKLSSYAARHLADADYHSPLAVNWVSADEQAIRQQLTTIQAEHPQRLVVSSRPFGLPARLWEFIVTRLGVQNKRNVEISRKDTNRLVNALAADAFTITSRAPFKDEFVTCGGVALTAVNPSTLESRHRPRLYFAGEVLDIDGITGGFNFQAAWTTAHTVAQAIATNAASS